MTDTSLLAQPDDIHVDLPAGDAGLEEVAVFPVSFAQQRLWFLDRLDPGSTLYNMPLVQRMVGPLDTGALRRALEEIVARHDALRTVFATVDGEPVQVVAPPAPLPMPVVDLSHLDGAARDEAVRARVAEETGRPFDLRRGPLFRATLVRAAADDHVLVLAMHHIVGDAWSMGVLRGELSALYEAFQRGLPSPLPELPIQYADFAAWQRDQLDGEGLDAQVAWWKRHFQGAPPLLELPLDRPRPPVQTYRGAQVTGVIPPPQMAALNAAARAEGCTLFMAMLAALSALLARYAGQDHVVVGTAVAGREMEETEPLIGFFVNTLAIRADLSGDPSFRTLLRRVREASLGAWAHQDVPFERLVEELRVERSLSHAPLFQVVLNVINTPAGAGERGLGDATFAPLPETEAPGEKYDLTVSVQETPGGAAVVLSYNRDLFDAATAGRMLAHLGTLLTGAIAEPDRPLSRLPLMDGDEAARVAGFTRGERRPSPAPLLHRLFEEQVALRPDAPALRFGGETTTYAALNAWANRISHRLLRMGIRPEERVAISVERGVEGIAAILGVLKAGAAYVPVDPAYPAERRRYMMEDSGARVVLTQRHLASSLSEMGAELLAVDDEAEFAGESAENPDVAVDPANLAYVIYTSGSTGLPKGVMVPHRGAVNLPVAAEAVYGMGVETRFLHSASLSFDASVFEWVATLGLGGCLVLGTRDQLIPGPELKRLIETEEVAMAVLPHSVLAALPSDGMPMLTTVATGGEACSAEVAQRWSRGRRFFNAYGPTEITVTSSIGPAAGDGRRPPIGAPLPNTRSYVLDAHAEPVPVGVPGELCVGGVGVTRGYLGRPGLTAERFVPDPYAEEPGARMYHTGDLVRWLPDGSLDYLRRMDDQVKIRGFRIELGEIESVLRHHEEVADVAVIVREDRPGDRRIVAYFVVRDGMALTPAALRAHAAERLPEHAVPAALVPLGALPLTPNGKVDRRALPAPDASATAETFVAAAGEMEETLAALWRSVLGVERVGVGDNFFEIGGHSLLLAQVQTRLKSELGREVAMVDLFRFPTIRSLAAHLDSGAKEDAAVAERAQEKAQARRSAREGRRERRGR